MRVLTLYIVGVTAVPIPRGRFVCEFFFGICILFECCSDDYHYRYSFSNIFSFLLLIVCEFILLECL